jgi:hypothetical protein
VTLAKIVG